MTPATIFSSTRMMTAASSDTGINEALLTDNNKNTKSTIDTMQKSSSTKNNSSSSNGNGDVYQKMHISHSSINVYDQVLICLFCSQFFQSQDEYRPSYGDMVHSEKKASYLDLLDRKKKYWDPLKMLEKDKEKEESEKKEKAALDLLLLRSSGTSYDDINNDVTESLDENQY